MDTDEDLAARIAGVSVLADPVRRALYRFVAAQDEPVSRDQAAAGTALPRHTAKFHLDRLVEEGLLDTEYRRLSGRRGPGAGRPAKLYRRSARELDVSVPERRYDAAGRVLADAVTRSAAEEIPVMAAVEAAAADAGHRLAASVPVPDGADGPDRLVAVLAGCGYEPRVDGGSVVLANCPFHALARDHTALVCGMNLHMLSALVAELGCPDLQAVLDPAPGRCCVRVGPRAGG
ncbi:helix-turn-helix transcriptional regulator [Modestobacter marinus]|uniref:helix-turn-helix transcriptional regulator n=1 Tax=Modestobacter marinus TaxID=477641 RepID=UPI001C943E74|nr:helix-turn-helix domain-containing protein [Modestobacter marinus]